MVRRLLLSAGLLLVPFLLSAQAITSRVIGTVVEEDSGQPVIQAAVQMLSAADSTQIDIAVTDAEGRFALRAPAGDYIFKFSYSGFITQYRNVHQTASQSDFALGLIQMPPDVQMLKASVVAAKVEPVTIVEDTVVYNAAAYRVPEDAMLDELLKKIPGLEIDSGGNVTLHGKAVKQIYVNGQRFFGGDVKTGLKNLQANMVENIKAYDRPSDFSRITGIEDGEEEPVLDLTIKKNMMNGWRGNLNAAGGSHDRTDFRANANKIEKEKSSTVIAGLRNTNGKVSINTTSRSQLGGGSNGDRLYMEAGGNFTRKTNKMELVGHIQASATNREAISSGHSESLASSTATTWANTNGFTLSRNRVVKGDVSLEWRPTQYITLYFKPSFSYTYSSGYNDPLSVQFKKDPYEFAENPNDSLGYDAICPTLKPISNYASRNRTQSFNKNGMVNINAQITKRFKQKRGRSITLRASCLVKPTGSWGFNNYDTRYFSSGKKSLRNQYTYYDPSSDQKQLQLSYSEPLWKKISLQMTVIGNFIESRYNKDIYTFLYTSSNKDVKRTEFADWSVMESYRLKDHLASLPDGFESALDVRLSPKGSYHYNSLITTVNLRYFKKKLNLTVGAQGRPCWYRMEYSLANGESDSRKDHAFFIAPFITFKMNRSKTRQTEFTYRSYVGTPSFYNLLPVENGTTPTSIHIGNPDLKPSFNHKLNFSYHYSNLKKQNSFVFNAGFNAIQDATINETTYYPDYERVEDGVQIVEHNVRVTKPKNIDGNWNANASSSFTQTFRNNHFSMSNHAAGQYVNSFTYLYSSDTKQSDLNTSGRLMVKEMLELCYRNDWLEVIMNGGGEYTEETNSLRPDLNQKPLSLTGGISTMITFPWKMRVSTDFSILSQNGYSFSELNRDYYYWNAEIAQPILKGKATLKLDMYDILGQQINLTRSFGSSSRSINIFNGVNQYFLLRFIYRFKL